MKLKKTVKKGLFVLSIYIVFTLCLVMASERIERLESSGSDFRNTNTSVAINFSK